MYEAIIKIANDFGADVYTDFPLSKVTSFQTGGNADVLILPNSEEALRAMLIACKAQGIRNHVIGNGSNLLVSDSGVRGIVFRIGAPMAKMEMLDRKSVV